MWRFAGRARIGIQLGRRIGKVHFDPFDQRPKTSNRFAFTGAFHIRDHFGRQLQVPSVIKFAGFQHGASGGAGISATLKCNGRKGWLCGITIVIICLHLNHIIGSKIGYNKGPGANRVEILIGAFGGFGAHTIFKLGFLNDRGGIAHKRPVRVGFWRVKIYRDRKVIYNIYAGNPRKIG